MTKRILAMLLAVLLAVSCFALTACGGEEEKPNEKPGNTQTPGNTDPGTTPGTTPGTGEEEGTAPQVVTYTETIVIGEEADPYGADLYVFISGNDEGAVTFKSSNDAVFTVDANGTITPVAPGTAKLTITAKAGELETTKEVDVTIREIWNPTDAVSKEVVSIMRNKELINCPLSLYNANFSGSTYNTEGVEGTTAGPVEIWGSEPHLQ